MNSFRTLGCACLSLALGLSACADEGGGFGSNNSATTNNGPPSGDADHGSTNGGFVPEVEHEFEFAAPAVVGNRVFVANETSNTVAVIDSQSLAMRTVPVGFGPTRVVGPSLALETSRVFVLNAGASTVSIVDPDSLEVGSTPVMRRANSLIANPRGEYALAWFDEDLLEPDAQAGDLSAVTLITAEGVSHQIAVGFRVQQISFTTTGNTALILTDDGVSVLRMTAVSDDILAVPIAVLPPDLETFDATDREVLVSSDGEYAVARVGSEPTLVLTSLTSEQQWRVALPTAPTDLDWVGEDSSKLLAMLPGLDRALLADVPAGLQALAAVTATPSPQPDAGSMDAGSADAGSSDAGLTDADAGHDVASDASIDAGPEPGTVWAPAVGVSYIALQQPRLGAAEVDVDGEIALLFSTIGERLGGVLLNLDDVQQRSIAFEKGIRGAVPDPRGEAFVVLHTREEGGVPPTATPADPLYIARSWGISIVDVDSGVTRLVLTEQKPGDVALWNDGMLARLYMIFEGPQPQQPAVPSHRDVLRVDLDSFAIESFRVSSLPDGLGTVPDARRVYVNQIHPQGRITFVDVDDDSRQTVTGYQLNAGID